MIANFFWHGGPLSLYESACLSSFVNAGARVRLFAFDARLDVPAGVERCDASAYGDVAETQHYSQGPHRGSLAAFSDIFRYRLLADSPGWWFDTDVMCLQPAGRFSDLVKHGPGLLMGEESVGQVNGAVLHIADPSIAKALLCAAEQHGLTFAWGAIGPRLLARYATHHPEQVQILPPAHFYPVRCEDALLPLDPEARGRCDQVTANALTVHLWNGIFEQHRVPKNVLPPTGSWLHERFRQLDVRVAADASLPWTSIEGLRLAGSLSRLDHLALTASRFIKNLRGVSG